MDSHLTCPSTLGAETLDLPLKLNAIRFYTGHCGATRERVGHFETLLRTVSSTKTKMLFVTAANAGYLNQDVHSYVVKHFPQYLPVVQSAMLNPYFN
jgi:hypothetical protein